MVFYRWLTVFLISLALVGCALSPQRLQPKPTINQSLPKTGNGQTISLKVVDQRASPSIGTRGGLYSSTSSITVAGDDIIPKLQQQAEQALKSMGYNPTTPGSSTTLTIILGSIHYNPSDNTFNKEVTVKAVLREQLQTTSRSYNGRYSSTVSQAFASAPNLDQNNTLVSNALSNVLTNLFKDANVTKELEFPLYKKAIIP